MLPVEHLSPKPLHLSRFTPVPALRQAQEPRSGLSAAHSAGQFDGLVGVEEPHVADATLSLDGHWAMCSCGANDYATTELDDAKAWVCDRAALQARHRREIATLLADHAAEVIENERRIERKRLALQRALADARIQLLSRA